MTNEQLQERCLEFAGFECYNAKLDIWLKPDGERTTPHLLDYPDFINSVDAHIKWTFPELRRCDYPLLTEIIIDPVMCETEMYTCYLRYDSLHDDGFVESEEVQGYADGIALAICEAIWELTEKGND